MRKRLVPLLCALLTLLSGCITANLSEQEGYPVYFASATLGGPALRSEPHVLDEDGDPIQGLLFALLAGPDAEDLTSPFPDGVRVRSTSLDGDGLLTVDLSERYGGLSGVDLTIADYAIALTLCQLPQVEAVSITVEGDPIPFRDRQVLRSADVVFFGREGEPAVLTAELYYPKKDGSGLTTEARSVVVTETEARTTALVSAVLSALLEGPQDAGLYFPLPEGTQLLSADLEDGVCYVNFSAAFLDNAPSKAEAKLLLYSIVDTLTGLEAVDSVYLLVEGETLSSYGGVNTAAQLEFSDALLAPEHRS